MRGTRLAVILAVGLATATVAAPAHADSPDDRGRQVLSANDGWAAADGGTTGGAAATDDNVFRVSTWQELRDALGGDDARGDETHRIVYVEGTINANETPDGDLLSCDDYADPEYRLEDYLDEYDPETWGANDLAGPLEEARARSNDNQDEQIRQYIGSNVTLIGADENARIVNASITIRGSDNVIVRNLEISDAYDCFPGWDPTDSGGNWNSEFDNIWITESTHVWVDHVSLNDGANPPDSLPFYFGKKFETHDGMLDITNGSDLVTVSWSKFTDHDKVMLIGSSDSRISDRGKLRVTLHHNLFENTGQRTPRVRFGQVHIFNNYYKLTNESSSYQYSWGAGAESQILAENNYFDLAPEIEAADVIHDWGGTMLEVHGSQVNGPSENNQVDLLAEYNAVHDDDLTGSVDWNATLYERMDPTQSIPSLVKAHAGAGALS